MNQCRGMIHVLLVLLCPQAAIADLYVYFDYDEWFAAANTEVTEIDFTGFAFGTPITDQYADVGLLLDPWANIYQSGNLHNDGWGVHADAVPGGRFQAVLDAPRYAFAASWSGSDAPIFRMGEEVVAMSDDYGGSPWLFVGYISDEPFDSVEFWITPSVDNIWFGAPVPAPGALTLVLTIGIARRRRARA